MPGPGTAARPRPSGPPPVAAPARKRPLLLWVGGGAALLALCIAGVGIFAGWQLFGGSAGSTPTQRSAGLLPSQTAPAAAPSATTRPAATNTARPSATATRRVAPSATPVKASPTQIPPTKALGKDSLSGYPIVFQDSFDNNNYSWTLKDGSTDGFVKIQTNIKDGVFHGYFKSRGDYYWRDTIGQNVGERFLVRAKFRQLDGKPDALHGLVFRSVDGEHFYAFVMADNHSFGFWVRRNEKWTRLYYNEWTNHIYPGEWNDMAVLADGKVFQLYVNEYLVGSTTNDWFTNGMVGLFFSAGADSIGEFEVDDFIVAEP